MDSGYYAAMTGLVARTQALDTAASNLANVQTPGYRAEREYFRSVLLGSDAGDSQLGRAMNNYGMLGGDLLNMAQGAITTTGNPFDLAIEGEGFFQVMTSNGVRFTRDGSFRRSVTNQLVTSKGEAVLSSTGQAIQLPPGEVTIGADGVISVAGGTVATLGVMTFSKETRLTPEGGDRYAAPADAKPVLSQKATVRQGAIESANEDVIRGSLDLIVMQRQAEMMQRALTVFHSEFNKIASEDLPKV
jgi:flagellar basal-body rod protein FlgF/flagellar basal-body rod protein FlgG